MSTIAEMFRLRPVPGERYLKPDSVWDHWGLPIPYTGIELELENPSEDVEKGKLWRVVPDDSLRNGIELVSSVLDGNRMNLFFKELEDLYYHNVRFDNSHRCSTHVHVNMHMNTISFVRNFIAVYATLEDALFSIVDRSRIGNNYCYSITHLDPSMDFLIGGGMEKDIKYCALNPGPLRTFGTIEFRHLQGLENPDTLKDWLKVIYSIYNYVERVGNAELRGQLQVLNTTSLYLDYVQNIFGDNLSLFGDLDWHGYMGKACPSGLRS